MTETRRRLVFLVLFAIVFFQRGAHVSQVFVNYPAWDLIGSASFPAYHRVMTAGALRYLFFPRVIEVVLAIVVLVFPPRPIGRPQMAVAMGLALAGLICTMLIQRPIHVQLETLGNTPELLARLRTSDWIRQGVEWISAGLYLWMAWRLVDPKRDAATRPGSAS